MLVIPISYEFMASVRDGSKQSTIRHGLRFYPVGEAILRSKDDEQRIFITGAHWKRFSDLEKEDAQRDGFLSVEDLRRALRKFYPRISDEDQVTIVEFKRI